MADGPPDLDNAWHEELKELVQMQRQEIAKLRRQMAELRDQIARLKGKPATAPGRQAEQHSGQDGGRRRTLRDGVDQMQEARARQQAQPAGG